MWHLKKVGDIVEVNADKSFPCDLLLLRSESEDNQCFITTANLDGEINLKVNWNDQMKLKFKDLVWKCNRIEKICATWFTKLGKWRRTLES